MRGRGASFVSRKKQNTGALDDDLFAGLTLLCLRTGKGDPRWIVEQRPDAKNCKYVLCFSSVPNQPLLHSSWHWEEKDASKWCRERLEHYVSSMTASDGSGNSISVSRVSKMDGEVNWYNRKGKLFTLYDLQLGLDFTGKRGEETLTGTVKIADFEQDAEQKADFRVSVGTGTADDKWKAWAREAIKKQFIEVWSRVVVDLHEDQKLKAPALTTSESTGKVKLPEVVQQAAAAKEAPPAPAGVPGSVQLSHVFQASVQDLWELFTNVRKAEHFTQSKTVMDAKEGGMFQLYDGVITGCFLELKPYTEMRFAWRLKVHCVGCPF